MPRWLTGMCVVLLGLSPQLAYACPVCFQAKDDASRVAFIVTTGFLTALPLVLLGGLLYWAFRRARALDEQDSREPLPSQQSVDR